MINGSEPTPNVCARYLRVPEHPLRVAEGGRRLLGRKPHRCDKPLVSIVTVVRNRDATIEQCVLSVLRQTYENLEYIVVDGASNDGTLDVIQRYADSIDYFVSEPDDGIYAAMNKGISVALGDYLLFLNSDDWYRENAVERLVAAALQSGADVVHADATTVDAKGKVSGTIEGWLHPGIYTSGNLIRHETMLVKREVYDRFGGYDTSYPIIADYVFVIRLFEAACHFEHVPEGLLYFRKTGVSNTAEAQRLAERARLFRSLFPFLLDEDLQRLTEGRLSNSEILGLIDKYKGESEVFARSLAFNIGASPSFRIAEKISNLAARMRRTPLWSITEPLRHWLYRRLPRS